MHDDNPMPFCSMITTKRFWLQALDSIIALASFATVSVIITLTLHHTAGLIFAPPPPCPPSGRAALRTIAIMMESENVSPEFRKFVNDETAKVWKVNP